MTGMEMIIIKGNEVILGKVRHDGYDAVDWLKANSKLVLAMPFEDIWPDYFKYHMTNVVDMEHECESSYNFTGYRFTPGKLKKHPLGKEEAIISEAQRRLRLAALDPVLEDGFTCSYGDYGVVIDLDKQRITINGMAMAKFFKDYYA